MKKKLIGFYCRVSSAKQDIEKFKYYISEYEKCTGEIIDQTVFEKVSATKTTIQERGLWTLIDNNDIKKIIVPSVSRIGRSVPDGVDLLRKIRELRDDLIIYVMDKNLTIKTNMSPGDEYTFYNLINHAAYEVHNRSEAVKKGLRRRKDSGLPLGRKVGSITLTSDNKKMIKALLRSGHTIKEVSASINKSEATIYRYLKRETKEIVESFGYSTDVYKWSFKTGELEKR